jgi:hypothetical protein
MGGVPSRPNDARQRHRLRGNQLAPPSRATRAAPRGNPMTMTAARPGFASVTMIASFLDAPMAEGR